jgi:tRNA (mo5U34)-methyltransferase
MPFRRLKMGSVEVALGVDDGFAERMRQSFLWKMRYGHASRSPAATSATHERDSIAARIAAINWYHTIDVGHGVVTPGMFDHRAYMKHYPIPERLDGMRVLDVATYDGFWAFEFERRGAAEVLAIDLDTFGDLDIPPAVRAAMTPEQLQRKVGAGFALASELRQSKVKRIVCSVYDLSPEKVGKVDFVFCGSLLLHLRDPLRALERIRSVTGAVGVFVETYNPGLPMRCAEYKGGSQRSVWWSWSLDCLHKIIEDAGYSRTEMLDTFALMNIPEKRPIWHAAFRVTR